MEFLLKTPYWTVFPSDITFETISRTYSEERLTDALIISFTHTKKMDHLLPGVEATGRRVEPAFIVIIGIGNDKVAYKHILWDQASMLVQLGKQAPEDLAVVGASAVAKLRNPALPDPFFDEG